MSSRLVFRSARCRAPGMLTPGDAHFLSRGIKSAWASGYDGALCDVELRHTLRSPGVTVSLELSTGHGCSVDPQGDVWTNGRWMCAPSAASGNFYSATLHPLIVQGRNGFFIVWCEQIDEPNDLTEQRLAYFELICEMHIYVGDLDLVQHTFLAHRTDVVHWERDETDDPAVVSRRSQMGTRDFFVHFFEICTEDECHGAP